MKTGSRLESGARLKTAGVLDSTISEIKTLEATTLTGLSHREKDPRQLPDQMLTTRLERLMATTCFLKRREFDFSQKESSSR